LESTQINNGIPFIDFGRSGEVLHFAHANAYPPDTYKQLIDSLKSNHHVISMLQRPLWPDADYDELNSWHQLADDMIIFFDNQNLKDVVGIGHSLGAVVSALAAQKRPDLFSKLILIEPVLFPRLMTTVNKFLSPSFCKKVVPICKIALGRTDRWKNQQELFDSYRRKKVFSKMPDESIWDWIRGGTVRHQEGGITLKFTKEWEAHIYATVTYGRDAVMKAEVPVYILKGEKTDVISDSVWQKLHHKLGADHLIEYKDTTHLLPLEKANEVAQDVMRIIKLKE